ncbi:MAG: hypothetical protein ACRDCK_03015, partial [Plesiomonas shigelloides]
SMVVHCSDILIPVLRKKISCSLWMLRLLMYISIVWILKLPHTRVMPDEHRWPPDEYQPAK